MAMTTHGRCPEGAGRSWKVDRVLQFFVFHFCPPCISFIFTAVQELNAIEIRKAVRLALAEDIGSGDATTLAIVPKSATASAVMRAREPLVLAGLAFAETAFR